MTAVFDQLNKLYQVDEEKIDKMSKINMAPCGLLPMPEIGESITVIPKTSPTIEMLPDGNQFANIRASIYGRLDSEIYDWHLSRTAWLGIRKEYKRLNMPMDSECKCIIGIPITISGKAWNDAPAHMHKMVEGRKITPKTYNISVRDDLSKSSQEQEQSMSSSQATLMTF